MGFNLDKGGGSGKDFNLAKGDKADKGINLDQSGIGGVNGGTAGSMGDRSSADGGRPRVITTERKSGGALILGTIVLLAGAGWFFFGRSETTDGAPESSLADAVRDSSTAEPLAVGLGGADSTAQVGPPSPPTTVPSDGQAGSVPTATVAAATGPSSPRSTGDTVSSADRPTAPASGAPPTSNPTGAVTVGSKTPGATPIKDGTVARVAATMPSGAGAAVDGPRRTADGVLIPAYFASNSALVDVVPADVLAEIKSYLAANVGARVSVVGHASSDGDPQANLALSVRRAEAVKAYLVSEGVDATRIDSSGKGADLPITSNDTASGRAKNRRVEVRL